MTAINLTLIYQKEILWFLLDSFYRRFADMKIILSANLR